MQQSPTLLLDFCHAFYQEFVTANARFGSGLKAFGWTEVVLGVATMVVALAIDSYASYVLSRIKKSKRSLLVVEFLAVLMTGIACFLPGAPLRFFYGLVFFASGMSIHSRVCVQFLDMSSHDTLQKESAGKEPLPPFWDRFFLELANTMYFNVFSRIHSFGHVRLPSFSEFMRMGIVVFMSDVCTYLIREWIPAEGNISPGNRNIAIAVVGGVWSLCAMDFAYRAGILQLDLFGSSLPTEMRHKHPLLSESLTEFWGVRWNPIIGKLLQDSFYKPLRRVGASRAACVVACFTGSAVLHAVPQYLATQSPADSAMMFAFFFLQGVCLVAELVVKRMFRCTPVTTLAVKPLEGHSPVQKEGEKIKEIKEINGKKEGSAPTDQGDRATKHEEAVEHSVICKSAPYQFVTEFLLVTCILSVFYYALELRGADGALHSGEELRKSRGICAALVVSSFSGAVTLYYYMRRSIHRSTVAAQMARESKRDDRKGNAVVTSTRSAMSPYTLKEFAGSLVGWLWVVASIMTLLPLFSLPVLHAVEALYTQSFFVGAMLRAAQRVLS